MRARLEGDFTVETVAEANPFADPERRELYALFVGLLWHYASQNDRYGILKNLAEPEVGDPLRVMLDGKLISQDVANSVREFTAVMDHLPEGTVRPLCIAELGAGYGRLAHVFSSALACRYWIFDIPPALYVSQWYLSRVFPNKRIFHFRHFNHFDEVREEVTSSDLCFFTANQLELVPDDTLDAFVSISSLQEMTPAQIDNYLGLIQRKTRELVYFKQWIRSQNPMDGLVLDRGVYTLRGEWSAALERTDAIQDLFFEIVYRKTVGTPLPVCEPRSEGVGPHLAQAARLARRVRRWLTAHLGKNRFDHGRPNRR